MPADYASTAQALSVPLLPEPDEQVSSTHESIVPPWSRRNSSFASGRRNSSIFSIPAPGTATSLRDRAIDRMESSYRRVSQTFGRMTILQKIGAVLAGITTVALGIGFMILTGQIFEWLTPVAEFWEDEPLVYFFVWMFTFLMSFPPMVGWSTVGTVSGFLFGLWKGWAIFGTASVIGSTCSFIVSRTILSKFVHRLMQYDKRFAALSLTLKYDGLKLLCMIRLCPLPYSLCNGAISTFPSVHPLMYGLATAIISPKFLIPIFIGSRLRILARDGGEMSAGSKAVNVVSILVSISVGIFTGWYIYKRTLARAKQLEAEERASLRGSVQPTHPNPEAANIFSDDVNSISTSTLRARDEEESVGFYNDIGADVDDDHIALDPNGYRDEFTDNESDVFADGDGDAVEEAYTLHRHIGSK